jgi:uncharacterized delta-60 repeat protein
MSARRPLRSAVALVAALLVGVLFSAGAQAAPGDLDPTFSGDGKQTTDFGFGSSEAVATVRQPDGKIVAVGTLSSTPTNDFALARYNPDGSLDTSFSGDGRQVTDFGSGDTATGVALQADGKIVAVGHAGGIGGGGGDFGLARYNPDGSLDTSFSGDGKQETNFGGFGGFDLGNGVAIQSDGKIVAVGRAGGTGGDFGLARYNPDGSLDTSFSGDGKRWTDFGGSEEASGVAIQSDGKIVAVGRAEGTGDDDFALARYNPNGSLDTSFSGDGRQTTNFGFTDFANQVALQGDGQIVAVGFTGGNSGGDFALARYDTNGVLDPGFSGDGRQTTDFSPDAFDHDEATGVALQTDGKIVAVGPVGGNDFALARYDTGGALDPSFSGDGKQTTDFAGPDRANGVAIQPDAKIVAVGNAGGPGVRPGGDFALARYNPDGSLDLSFSGDGKQTTDFPGFDQANGVAIQDDGKIVAVGTNDIFSEDFALARYNPNGSLDLSFSGDGKQTTDFAGEPFTVTGATGVAIQPDNKIVAVGSNGQGGFALARYNPNGQLDPSFSGDGKQATDFGGFDAASGVALQPNGKIVVVGQGGPDPDFAIARYGPNGALDSSFSGDGRQTTSFTSACCEGDGARGVALQSDGKIVAVGFGGIGVDFALARYSPNGTLDPSFSGDGKQTTAFAGTGSLATGVALQDDGKAVAVGYDGVRFALARYSLNGSLDPSFSGDGIQTTDFAGGFGFATAVALQDDGKIVAVGQGNGTDGTRDFALARYLGG